MTYRDMIQRINEEMRATEPGVFVTTTGMAGALGISIDRVELLALQTVYPSGSTGAGLDDDIVIGKSMFKGAYGFVRVKELP